MKITKEMADTFLGLYLQFVITDEFREQMKFEQTDPDIVLESLNRRIKREVKEAGEVKMKEFTNKVMRLLEERATP